jgi:hypothetical protein
MVAGAITILDASAVSQDVLTEVIGGDNAEANVIYANGVIVSTAAPLPTTVVSGAVTMSGSVVFGLPAGATRTRKYLRITTTQTGSDVWDPTLDYFAVTDAIITWSGATACRITLWQGANADTTFSGTEPTLFDMDVDAGSNSGAVLHFGTDNPWKSDVADDELHLTTSANKTVAITLLGYETDTAG